MGKLPVSELERASLMFDIREVHGVRYVRVKRVIDIATGLVAGLVLLLVVPVVWVANLAGNRGPLFFGQERVGKGGEAFRMLKFRTMRQAAPGEEDDERSPAPVFLSRDCH